MSDSKLVQIAFIDAASHLPPPLHLLWCHPARGETEEKNHAAVAFAPFLLILLKSGPTDDETFLPFSGSLWKRFLIFTAGKKRPLACASSRPRIRSYHISRNENKRHDHFQKMSSTYHSVSVCVCVCWYAGGWGEAAPGCETPFFFFFFFFFFFSSVSRGRELLLLLLSFRLARNKNQHVGLPVFSPELHDEGAVV